MNPEGINLPDYYKNTSETAESRNTRLRGRNKEQTGGTSIMRGFMIRSRRMQWAGHVASMEKKRKANRALVAKPERKRAPLGTLSCR